MAQFPHEFWQALMAPGTVNPSPKDGFSDAFPATLPDGSQILLPVRVLPGDGKRAVESLIINQASFAVEDGFAAAMAELVRPYAPDVIVGVPTLGLPLANNVARILGQSRMVALGTSRKFWYEDALSEPMSSITSPIHAKRIFIDPRMLPLLAGRRVVVVDDVISSGTSMAAVLRLLAGAGIKPVAVAVAMLQSEHWKPVVAEACAGDVPPILSAITSPILVKTETGRWVPEPTPIG